MEEKDQEAVRRGFEHIAFGEVTDPIRLLFCDEVTPRVLKGMDLFNVAEIRRPKGGGMEIKFYDRIRALQCLQELYREEGAPDNSLYEALTEGARALSREDEA